MVTVYPVECAPEVFVNCNPPIQIVLVDPTTGIALATAIVRVDYGHPSDGHGRFFEATWMGADQSTVDARAPAGVSHLHRASDDLPSHLACQERAAHRHSPGAHRG